MNVLLLTDSDSFAGTERYMLSLASALRDGGEVIPAVACPGHSPLATKARGQSIDVIAIERGGTVGFHAVRQLVRLIHRRDDRFDVVHAHNGRTCLQVAMARQFAGREFTAKLVFTQHFLEPARVGRPGVRGRVSRGLGRWSLSFVDRTVAISQAVADAAIARGDVRHGRVTVVHNGIEPIDRTDSSASRAVDHLRIVCVARLEIEKRVDVLIDACQRLHSRGVSFSLDILGDGSLREDMRRRIAAAGLDSSTHLLGHCADVAERIAGADVLVLPSPAEPFGLVLLEAMSLARPVIAADAGGPREIVEEGYTGLRFKSNDPGSLAEAILQLASSPDRRVSMGLAGRQRFLAHFTAERMAQETLAVYRAAIGAKQLVRA